MTRFSMKQSDNSPESPLKSYTMGDKGPHGFKTHILLGCVTIKIKK